MSRITTLADLIAAGDLDGYRRYAPSGLGAGIDEEVARDATCDACGHAGCVFHGFAHGDSYLALDRKSVV